MRAPIYTGLRWPFFAFATGILLCDQLTKLAAEQWLRHREPRVLIPDLLQLDYARNPGGLGGMFRSLGEPWHTLILTGIPIVAIVLLAWFIARAGDLDRSTLYGLAFILGGAVGNVTDRVLYGEVIDFLDVWAAPPELALRLVRWFGTSHWPTFNIADSAIVTGAILMVTQTFRAPRE
ncbi:MAG: signal peptidase II [Acidobacteriota bacterium]|nr:signal peptidase II [Acidobacteriota bacterium]MDH3785872.1 signal peptidase II [Acidobacteriota bacterium]